MNGDHLTIIVMPVCETFQNAKNKKYIVVM